MPDQNDENKPRIVPPASTPAAPQTATASTRTILLSEAFEVPANPTLDELIRTMARMANFCNLMAAECLRSRVVTASNPAVMATLNASANLEQGALQQRAQMQMAAAGQFAAPGQGGGGGGMPPGMPPFRTH